MGGIKMLLFLVYAGTCCISGISGETFTVQENLLITMDFIPPTISFNDSYEWHKGKLEAGDPLPANPLFRYFGGKWIEIAPLSGMSVDAAGALTINPVLVEHDGYFTCKSVDSVGHSVYNLHLLQVYKTPTLTLSGLGKASYKEGDNVTVSCTLVDAFPDVELSMFTIVWKGRDFGEAVSLPPNKYYSYKIEKSFTLIKEDDTQLVTCSVQLKVGPQVKPDSKILNVHSLESKEVEENDQTTIPYITSATTPLNRFWYRGHGYNINNPPKADSLLFTFVHGGNKWVKGPAAHEDMAADPVNYALTISKVHLEDNGYISCKTFDRDTALDVYDHAVEVLVFKTPKLEMYGIDKIDYNVGDPVYLTCKLTDSYPEVDLRLFYIHWEGRTLNNKEDTTAAGDKYYSYRIAERILLEKEDDNLVVTCSVQLRVGKQLPSESRTLQVSHLPTSLDTSLPPGAIVGIVIGSAAVTCLVIAVLYYVVRIIRHRRLMYR